MSFRNGDKSRENRLRRARVAKRAKSQKLETTPKEKAAAGRPASR